MSLPPLQDVITAYGLLAKKSLGQHFLLDPALLTQIVRLAGDVSGQHIIEVGSGPGGLTRALLDAPAVSVIAVEKDSRAVAASEMLLQAYGERFAICEEDALKLDMSGLCPAPRMIVSNLPYNIGTALLSGWLEQLIDAPETYSQMLLMFQKEVADRIIAAPNSKAYGRFSVLCQWLCESQHGMDVPPEAFSPPPKVTSTVVRLLPRRLKARADVGDVATFKHILHHAFAQRRKMLRRSLAAIGEPLLALLPACGIDDTVRAETVPVEAWCALSKAYSDRIK